MPKDPVGVRWQAALLRDNPFKIVPPRSPKSVIWADAAKAQRKLNRLLADSLTSSENQLLVIYGDWGAGKTHAAQWYRDTSHIPAPARSSRVREATVLYRRMPKSPESASEDFYRGVFEQAGIEKISAAVSEAVSEIGEDAVSDVLSALVESPTIVKSMLALGAVQDQELRGLLSAFFLGSCTKSELRKLGFPRNIAKDEKFLVLGAALNCLIGLDPEAPLEERRRIILWLDELEDLVYFTGRYHRAFTQGLRDLFETVPEFFTLVLNTTYTSTDAERGLEGILGQALVERITERFALAQPSMDDVGIYVEALLDAYREGDAPRSIYPFTKIALKALAEGLPDRRPRRINRMCGKIIAEAIRLKKVSGRGKGQINSAFVNKILSEELADDEDE